MKQEKLVDYKNIIIVGNINNILAANYSYDYIMKNNMPNNIRKFSKLLFTGEDFVEKKAIELNTLFILNKYLKKIDLLSKEDENIVCNISIDNQLYDKITKGTYKYWLTYKKTNSNKEISSKELELWKEFVDSYLKVFNHIKFFSLNLYKSDRTPKYNRSQIDYGKFITNLLEDILKQEDAKLLKTLLG